MPGAGLRVALGPVDPAGTVGALADGLRALGVDAEVVLWFALAHRRAAGRVVGRGGRAAYAGRAPLRRDVLNYQGYAWLPSLLDAAWAAAWRRTLVATFHGDDCRLYGVARELFPARGHSGDPAQDGAVERRVRRLARICGTAIVPDLELATYVLPHFARVYVVPPALEAEPARFGDAPATGDRPVVLHAPSDPARKGTVLVEAAAERVAARVPFEFRLLTGVTHQVAVSEIRRADVVVDQLNSANIGVAALEAMRAGRPVVSQLQPDALAPYQRGLPVVPADDVDSLARALEALLLDADRRRELGEEGRRYVARHDPVAVARATLQVYAHAPTGERGLFEATPDDVRRLHDHERAIVARRRGASAA